MKETITIKKYDISEIIFGLIIMLIGLMFICFTLYFSFKFPTQVKLLEQLVFLLLGLIFWSFGLVVIIEEIKGATKYEIEAEKVE